MAYRALWWLGTLLDSLANLVTWVCSLMCTATRAFGLCELSVCILTLATSEEQMLCCLAVDDAPHLRVVIAGSVSVGRCDEARSYKASPATCCVTTGDVFNKPTCPVRCKADRFMLGNLTHRQTVTVFITSHRQQATTAS